MEQTQASALVPRERRAVPKGLWLPGGFVVAVVGLALAMSYAPGVRATALDALLAIGQARAAGFICH